MKYIGAFNTARDGRLTLTSTVLNAPMYFMSLCKVPQGVAKAMEKIMKDFLWGEADGDHHGH